MNYDEQAEILAQQSDIWDVVNETTRDLLRDGARHTLAAIGIEDPNKPKWPTNESVDRFRAAYRSCTNHEIEMELEWVRDCLREAISNDPIIKAAVALRDAAAARGWWSVPSDVLPVIDAVKESGR